MNLFYLIGAAFIGLGVISDKKFAPRKKVDTDAKIVPKLNPEPELKPNSINSNPETPEEETKSNEPESDSNSDSD